MDLVVVVVVVPAEEGWSSVSSCDCRSDVMEDVVAVVMVGRCERPCNVLFVLLLSLFRRVLSKGRVFPQGGSLRFSLPGSLITILQQQKHA
jgi:hypothetical protein